MTEPIISLNRETEIALVGGGLVGSLLALSLARRGFDVDVYERRPDMRTSKISAGRSINLALSTRGIKALNTVGLEGKVLEIAIPMRGRMIHPVKGDLAFQQYGKDDTEYINSISRGDLNKLLLSEAESTKHANFHFQQKAIGIDLFRNALELENENKNEITTLAAQIIIGTDGSASAIRNDMKTLPGFSNSEEQLDYGYKELAIPAGKKNTWQIEKHALHIWPRGTFMLIALPNLDGSFTCTLFLPFEGEKSFEKLQTRESVVDFFKTEFPDAFALMPDIAEDFFENPTGSMVTVKCGPWNVEGRSLLLGDAAHAIVPFFGQGMNCGFEDITVLEQCIDNHTASGGSLYLERRQKRDHEGAPRRFKEGSSGWRWVFDDFYRARKVNSDAIADLAVENFTEMRDKVGNPRFLLEKAVEKKLQNEFPGEYVSRYGLVTFTNRPYSLAMEAGHITDEILSELCTGISTPEEIDLKLAKKLIQTKLSPLLATK
ncbi:MAG: NAD(P)/FAD-dependent oxidoreductase [Candidatus Obscuribacterales bacterium]|nr:NAD(P)/FAD-dependent oxidoreductase [Candidatus Obscuribacterales bacterium]